MGVKGHIKSVTQWLSQSGKMLGCYAQKVLDRILLTADKWVYFCVTEFSDLEENHLKLFTKAVMDLGFPRWLGEGINLLFWLFFSPKLHVNKQNWTEGQARVPDAPSLGSANDHRSLRMHLQKETSFPGTDPGFFRNEEAWSRQLPPSSQIC